MRSIYVSTGCGCSMPGLAALADAAGLEKARDAQASTGRLRPQGTVLGRYVERRTAMLAPRLARSLRRLARRLAARAAEAYAKIEKDDTAKRDLLAEILAGLTDEDLGLDVNGELVGPMLSAFRRAAGVGAMQVGFSPEGITEQVDPLAVAYAERRGGELIRDLAGTTRGAMQSTIARAVDEGWSVDDLRERIEGLGAFGEARAEMIARTELAFAHVEGNVAAWRATGEVVGKRWILADTHPEPDECDEAAEKGAVGIDDEFIPGVMQPPAHPNCCLPGTVVSPGGRIAAHFTRRFVGEVVGIRTEGNLLTVTPNHPVLTQRGWVAAGALEVGDSLLQCADPAAVSALVDPDDDHIPARIEDVAGALLMAGGVAAASVPASAEAFHGDGMPDGKVDVVWAAGALPDDAVTGGRKHAEHPGLGVGHRWGRSLSGQRGAGSLGDAHAPTSDSPVRGGRHGGALPRRHPLGREAVRLAGVADRQAEAAECVSQRQVVASDAGRQRDAGLASQVPGVQRGDVVVAEPPLDGLRFGAAAKNDAAALEQAIDHLVRDAQLPGELRGRFAALVSAAQIIELERRQYEGHVFNLSTRFGWYIADGILVHNCLCDVVPVLRPD